MATNKKRDHRSRTRNTTAVTPKASASVSLKPTPQQPTFPTQRARWVRFWVTGKMSREVDYQLVNAGDVQDSAVMKEAAEEWARSTSIGQVAEYMRYGWEEVSAVPDRIVAEKVGSARHRIKAATNELELLTLTPTVPCCRRYGCPEPATRKAKLAVGMRDPLFDKGVIHDTKESDVCDECFDANERDIKNNRERLERLRAAEKAARVP